MNNTFSIDNFFVVLVFALIGENIKNKENSTIFHPFSDFNSPPPDIVCGNGMTTPNETRCLFTTSVFETVLGCRSLSHLQDCGMLSVGVLRTK